MVLDVNVKVGGGLGETLEEIDAVAEALTDALSLDKGVSVGEADCDSV